MIITIPDFMHATAAMWCMERGKHVYVQKPLTRTIWEARQLLDAASKYNVATQMGNQGYSNEGTRQAAEMIWAGEIGQVTEVHAWTDRPIWPQGLKEIPPAEPVPSTLDWDLWLGIAETRPYTSGGPDYKSPLDGHFYQPGNWRGFYDFGCGALGDMACHILGAPNLALQLAAPASVECVQIEGSSDFMFPKKSVIRYDFPARGSMPPVKLFWHDGLAETPKIAGVPDGELLGDLPEKRAPRRRDDETAVHRVHWRRIRLRQVSGRKERPTRGKTHARWQLVYRRQGHDHYRDLRRGDPSDPGGEDEGLRVPAARADSLAGPLPRLDQGLQRRRPGLFELQRGGAVRGMDVVGTIALRLPGKLEWDAEKGRFTNNEAANQISETHVS